MLLFARSSRYMVFAVVHAIYLHMYEKVFQSFVNF